MTKPIELENYQWKRIFERIQKEHPKSVWLIREKMKKKLGFVPREYKDWDDSIGKWGGWRKNCVMLDFYSEKHKSLFLIKYSDIINDRVDNNF